MSYIGIRGRIIGLVIVALVLSIIIAAIMFRNMIYQNIFDQKIVTADIITASIVHDIKYSIEKSNFSAVANSVISKYITYYRIIDNIQVYNNKGELLATSSNKDIGEISNDANIKSAIKSAKPSIIANQEKEDNLGIQSIYPLLLGSKIIGAIELEISINDLQKTLSEVNKDIFIILVITILVASIILYFLLQSAILNRLTKLTNVTKEISLGNYDIKIQDDGKDEIGTLAHSFDRMANDLNIAKMKIEDYNNKLECKISDSKNKLHETYEELKNAQGQIILHEKMASLGVLIAGIAHEINTPVGAINNVSRELKKKVYKIPDVLKKFSDIQSVPQNKILCCLEKIIDSAKEVHKLPTYNTTKRIEELLIDNDIKEWRNISKVMVSLGITDDEWILNNLKILSNNDALTLIETVGIITQAVTIAETSSKKIQDIIQALKYYAYTDKDKVERIQINASIKTALVLMQNKFKHEIEIITEFDENLPLVFCTNEIHQIWTNLLSNAIHAISIQKDNIKGKIVISTFCNKKNTINVTVSDNGVGIPSDRLDNIFDPFYTTKDVGEGTGLGLSIVTGIIKKHHGTINVNSQQGITKFEISLPVKGFNSLETNK